MKVICIESSIGIDRGKQYEVVQFTYFATRVINNFGVDKVYIKEKFVAIDVWRDMVINELLN